MKFSKNKYIKYKKAELERFIKNKESCVTKINRTEVLGIAPHHLSSIKNYITCVLNAKIGKHHKELNGIVLDFRNVKILNTNSEIRFEDPLVRITIIADFYVFQPIAGAILRGIIKHTNQLSLGVILYRVFTVSIRLSNQNNAKKLYINQDIEFKVIGFNFDNKFASIDGEFIKCYKTAVAFEDNRAALGVVNKVKKFNNESDDDEIALAENPKKPSKSERKSIIKKEPAPRLSTSSDSSSSSDDDTVDKSKVGKSVQKVTVKKESVSTQSESSNSSSDDDVDSKHSLAAKIMQKNVCKSNKKSISSSSEGKRTSSSSDSRDNSTFEIDSSFPVAGKGLQKNGIKKESVSKSSLSSSESSSSDDEDYKPPAVPVKTIIKQEPVSKKKSVSSSSSDERKPMKSKLIFVNPREETSSESLESELEDVQPSNVLKKVANNIKQEPSAVKSALKPTNGTSKPRKLSSSSDSSEDEIKALFRENEIALNETKNKIIDFKKELTQANQRKRKRESSSSEDNSSDSEKEKSPPAKKTSANSSENSFSKPKLTAVRRKLLQSDSDSSETKEVSMTKNKKNDTSLSGKMKHVKEASAQKKSKDNASSSKKNKNKQPVNDEDPDLPIDEIFARFNAQQVETPSKVNGSTSALGKKSKRAISNQLDSSISSILKPSTDTKKKKKKKKDKSRKSVQFVQDED